MRHLIYSSLLISSHLLSWNFHIFQVALQVLGLIGVDVVILILWTAIERPSVQFTEYSGQGLQEPVSFNSCNTNLNSRFEQVCRSYAILFFHQNLFLLKIIYIEISYLIFCYIFNLDNFMS